MKSSRRTRSLVLALIALGGAGCGSSATQTWERPGLAGAVRPEMGKPQPGDRAPDFQLPIAGGGSLRLASLRGVWVVLHFTATWCPLCDAEVEHLGRLADAYAARGVRVLLVDLKEDLAHYATYAEQRVPASVIPLYDASGETADRYAPPGAQPSFSDRTQVMFDTTLVVDPDGVIRLFLLPDSAHFDPTFRGVRSELDRLVGTVEPPLSVSVTPPAALQPGVEATLVVHVAIRPEYHVMSARPSLPNYIATRVRVEPVDAFDIGAPGYPQPVDFDLGERRIATYQGNIEVSIPLRAAANAPAGDRMLRGSIRYQACTRGRCFAPAALPFHARLRIERTSSEQPPPPEPQSQQEDPHGTNRR
jgi:peroxiredoxin Q/BCP